MNFRVNTVITVNPKDSKVETVAIFRDKEDAMRFMDRFGSITDDFDLYRKIDNRHGSDGFDWIDVYGDGRPLELYKKRGHYYITIPYEDRYTESSVNPEPGPDLWDYRLRDRTHNPEYTEPLEDMQELNPYGSQDDARLRQN